MKYRLKKGSSVWKVMSVMLKIEGYLRRRLKNRELKYDIVIDVQVKK